MLEILSGLGLSAAAGLNAYIPLIALGLAGRFLDFVTLPAGWSWLSNEWVLLGLGVLLVIELIADKIPVVDSINDWIQTVIRPAAGGIVFGTGAATETSAISDPAQFFTDHNWVPVLLGVGISLAVHLTKMAARPVANALTLGVAAPVISVVEDFGSVALTVLAILLPVFVILALVGIVWFFVAIFRKAASRRRTAATAPPIPQP
ncbi:DUF4126 domain-containing protein [Glaciihabitans arcticus]|uniref:DUF4126 domain-containing protein n=1 Tax=Glaciihabitans arcticus TaxID=2668039 RepID=A0A4Q9GPJ9_9MICO|nr:DUF4126 domain-containing protein [Glaciihabitans arcticus]TBN56706.1 DUF4126 domain-containing protein [Glaciihabitans arcticus]